jgi:hypothetical protein
LQQYGRPDHPKQGPKEPFNDHFLVSKHLDMS